MHMSLPPDTEGNKMPRVFARGILGHLLSHLF